MTFQTTALIKLHGSHGPVSWEIPPSNEVLLKWVWRRTPMQTCSRILILLSKTFFFSFSAFWAEFKARQRQTQRIVNHVMISNKLKGELKRLNRLTFFPTTFECIHISLMTLNSGSFWQEPLCLRLTLEIWKMDFDSGRSARVFSEAWN